MARVVEALAQYLGRVGVEAIVMNTGSGRADGTKPDRLTRLAQFIVLAHRVAHSKLRLVHCHSGSPLNLLGHGLVILVAKGKGKSIVLTLHGGSLSPRMVSGALRGWPLRTILRSPESVTSTSPELAAFATEVRGEEVTFIPNVLPEVVPAGAAAVPLPADVEAFIATHSPVVVFVGAMLENYAPLLLVEAMKLVRKHLPSAGCLLIAYKLSDLAYSERVVRAIDKQHMSDVFLIPRGLPSVLAAVAACDLMVRPCYPDADSIAVGEALALGIRVVASRVASRPPSVVTFEPGNAADFACKMLETLALPAPERVEPGNRETRDESMRAYLDVYVKSLGLAARRSAPAIRPFRGLTSSLGIALRILPSFSFLMRNRRRTPGHRGRETLGGV
jgi:glycosyltransferase involved in cell wall biosynthesis